VIKIVQRTINFFNVNLDRLDDTGQEAGGWNSQMASPDEAAGRAPQGNVFPCRVHMLIIDMALNIPANLNKKQGQLFRPCQ
jgi:hypothetical protein